MNVALIDNGASPQLLPASDPLIPPADRGFTYGDGLFETIRVLNGAPLFVNRHLTRLVEGLAILNLSIPWPSTVLAQRIQELIAANQAVDGVIRLTISRGNGPRGFNLPTQPNPLLIIQVAPQPSAPPPASVALAPWHTDPASPLTHLKSLSALDKVLAKDLARRAGADDALFQNLNGHLTETTSSNLFGVQGDEILTPALECGLLAGITRQILIEMAPNMGQRIIETKLTLNQLTSASEAFLTNAVSGLRPLVAVNGQTIGDGHPGALFAQLKLAYQQFCWKASQKPATQETL